MKFVLPSREVKLLGNVAVLDKYPLRIFECTDWDFLCCS